jgi:urease accessory protein
MVHTTSSSSEQLARVRLLQLVSPSLPIGSFTYSQGLEWAVEQRWVDDEASLAAWLDELLQGPLTRTDLPLLARLYGTAGDDDLERFAELRAEERQKGRALRAVLDELEPDLDPAWRYAVTSGYLAGFAWACARWAVPVDQAAEGYAYGWLENQVIAAVKLVPLGQAAGQRVLHKLTTRLPALVTQALATGDEALGASATTLAIASACHESQYTRLYRS